MILSQERLELPSGITAAYGCRKRIWVSLAAANIVPLRVSTTREKSLEPRIPLSRSFHLSGRRRAAFSRIPLLPGDNCGQAFGINKHGHVAGYSSGPNGRKAFLWTRSSGRAQSRRSARRQLQQQRATSTIWMRLPAHLGARPVTVPSFGRKPAICAILGRCREIRRARLAQSTTMGMSLGTRKVHGACALFCGLKQLECRIWGCSLVETPAERLVSTTWVLWLEVRQARREIAPLYGQNKQA